MFHPDADNDRELPTSAKEIGFTSSSTSSGSGKKEVSTRMEERRSNNEGGRHIRQAMSNLDDLDTTNMALEQFQQGASFMAPLEVVAPDKNNGSYG